MPETRSVIARGFTLVEDVVYIGMAILLTALVLTLLVLGAIEIVHSVASAAPGKNVIALLDRILLILLIVELLYTVQVSFKAHALAPEPFLLVGLISAIRRVLLLTAQLGEQHDGQPPPTEPLIIELGVLAALILALAVALRMVRQRSREGEAAAERG